MQPFSSCYFRPPPFGYAPPGRPFFAGGPALARRTDRAARMRHGDTPLSFCYFRGNPPPSRSGPRPLWTRPPWRPRPHWLTVPRIQHVGARASLDPLSAGATSPLGTPPPGIPAFGLTAPATRITRITPHDLWCNPSPRAISGLPPLDMPPLDAPSSLEAPPSLDVLVALHACDTAIPLSLYYFRPRPTGLPQPHLGRNHVLAFTRDCDDQYCMVYSIRTGGSEGESYTVQSSCNSTAPGWAMQVGGGGERMVDSCTTASN